MPLTRSRLPTCCAWLAATALAPVVQAGPPPGAELRDASIAIGYDTKDRCPDLVRADAQEPAAALVVLIVGPSGVPSQASIKTSSGAADLDAAAIGCVAKLRFLPSVRAGEGTAVASWQEIAWKWSRQHAAQAATPAAGAAAAVMTPAPALATAAMRASASAGAPGVPEVRVCADESGKVRDEPRITRSSGDASLDAAAIAVARSGAPYYRPTGGAAVSGCVQIAIRFEQK